MSKKIQLDKEELIKKYKIEKLSQKDTAKYFNVSVDVVVRNLKEYNIQSNKPIDWIQSNNVTLNDHQINFLYGAMLGDGGLVKSKNGVNAQFCYTSKSLQHVEFVTKDFIQYSYKEGLKKYDYKDKRTNKTYSRYTYRSISDTGFTEQYNIWYKDGIKHIPNSLKLNSEICLVWYIGDGGICNSSISSTQRIKLATNCFLKEEQENILLPQLKLFNPVLQKTDSNQYIIIIPRKGIFDFIDYIGECPFNDYLYKWNIKERINPSYTKYYNDWIKLYNSGVGYTKIAKIYGADNTTVLKFFQKEGIYKYKIKGE